MKNLFTKAWLIGLLLLSMHYGPLLAQITVTSPASGVAITQCSSYILRFTSPQNSYGSAEIYKGGVLVYIDGFNNLFPNSDNNVGMPALQPGNDYQIKVYNYYNPTDFDWSDNFSIIALSPPTATVATSMGQSQFTANWNPVSGATDYRIDVSTNSDFSTFVSSYNNLSTNSLTGGPTSKAIYSSILPGTTYYYRLRTVKGTCTSSNSNTITVLTKPSPPVLTLPTEVSNKTTPSFFTTNWSSTQSATEYWVDVSTDNSFSSYAYHDAVSYTNSYSATGLSPNITHYVRVRSKNASGLSNYSSTFTVSPISVPVTSAATYIGSTGFQANWYSPSATWYYLDVSTSSAFLSFVPGYNNYRIGASSIYLYVPGLQPNTTYHYRVRSETVSGISVSSNVQSVLTYPSAPTSTSATSVTSNSFVANWNSVSGITEYRLDVATNSGFTAGTILASHNNLSVVGATTQSVTGLSPNTPYYYRVRSKNASGSSTNSGTITVVTAPGAPNLLPATNITNNSFRSNWQAVTGASYYKIDVSVSAEFSTCVVCDQTVSALFYNVTGLSSNTTYYYRVRAVNGSGVTSGNSSTLSVITAPNAPTATIPTEIKTASPKFVANWLPVAGVSNYRIDVYTRNISLSCAIVTPLISNNVLVTGATSYTVATTSPGPFFYVVRAENASGVASSSSNEIPVVVANYTPSLSAASGITSNSFNANWNTVVNSVDYRLDVSTQSNFSTTLPDYTNKTVTGTTHLVDQNLTISTTYYYRLRANILFSGSCVTSGTGISAPSSNISVTTLCSGCRLQPEKENPIAWEEHGFGVYPNPVSGNALYVRLEQEVKNSNFTFDIFDHSGRKQSVSFSVAEKVLEADVSTLKTGLYIISMTVNNKPVVKKFMRK